MPIARRCGITRRRTLKGGQKRRKAEGRGGGRREGRGALTQRDLSNPKRFLYRIVSCYIFFILNCARRLGQREISAHQEVILASRGEREGRGDGQ